VFLTKYTSVKNKYFHSSICVAIYGECSWYHLDLFIVYKGLLLLVIPFRADFHISDFDLNIGTECTYLVTA